MMGDFKFVRCPNCGWEKNPRMSCFNCEDKKPPASSKAENGAELAAAKARIAELEEALEPLADMVTAFDENYYDHHQNLVLMEAGDARRAAALLKDK